MKSVVVLMAAVILFGHGGCSAGKKPPNDRPPVAEKGEHPVAPSELNALAPHAAGVWLVEVVECVEYDSRPCDGNKGMRVKLRGVRGSGQFHDVIDVVTAYGGLRPPGRVEPQLPTLIRPDTLQVGRQYWIAFASIHELEKYPQGVINYWLKGDEATEKALEEAVREDFSSETTIPPPARSPRKSENRGS
jgi:hypothetical protein